MYHHGWIEQGLHVKFVQSQIILNVRIFLDVPNCVLIA